MPEKEPRSADSFCICSNLRTGVHPQLSDACIRAEWHIANFVAKLKTKVDNPLVSPALLIDDVDVADMEVGTTSADLRQIALRSMTGLKMMLEKAPYAELQAMTKQNKQKFFAKLLQQRKLAYGFALKTPSAIPATIDFFVTVGGGDRMIRSQQFSYECEENTTYKCEGFERDWQELLDVGGGLTIGLEILLPASGTR